MTEQQFQNRVALIVMGICVAAGLGFWAWLNGWLGW